MPSSLPKRITGRLKLTRHVSVLRQTPSTLLKVRYAVIPLRHLLLRFWILVAFIVAIAVLVCALILENLLPVLPEPRDASSILQTFLTAQAAIAALSLAVTLFMMQVVRARIDINDRMYREYVRLTGMRSILWASLLAVGVTGVLVLSQGFMSGDVSAADVKPFFRYFMLLTGLAILLLNVVLAGLLFERAILYSRPEQWIALRRAIYESDVKNAIRAFYGRARRVAEARDAGELDFASMFPDQGEGSADEAVRAMLDDARRAMSERRNEELRRSLDSIRELVKYAMEELKVMGISWGTPGSQAEWPPLRELSRNLYSFREDVIRERDREYIFELLRFDYRITVDGLRDRCGELFTVGLNGYRWNYQISNRLGDREFQEIIRDKFSLDADGFLYSAKLPDVFLYAMEMVRHQEKVLSDAMQIDQPNDFDKLHRGFQAKFTLIRSHWGVEEWSPSDALKLFQELQQEYRIVLMGLGGRTLTLDKSNRIEDATPYLNVVRPATGQIENMAADLTSALAHDDSSRSFMWNEWEMERAEPHQAISIFPEKYPLAFFTLRLLELSSETIPTIDLRGRAKQVLDWFNDNSHWVNDYSYSEIGLSSEQRINNGAAALRSAVQRDDVAEDYDIIKRNLSTERISNFKSEIHSEAISLNPVLRVFQLAGRYRFLSSDSDDLPEERGLAQLLGKAYFTESTEGSLIYYAQPDGKQLGRAISDDMYLQFCKALVGSPKKVAPFIAPEAFLQSIDGAKKDLAPSGFVAIVLVGNWTEFLLGLATESPEGYQMQWQLPETDQIGEYARYGDDPIFWISRHESRRLYVVDIASWGWLEHAKSDDSQDMRIEIKTISTDRAQELLANNPKHFADQPDEESKIRKLRTCVEVIVGAHARFRVTDSSRARNLVSECQSS